MTIAAILGGKGGTVYSIDCDRSVREAVAMLAEHRIGALPVLRGGDVAGVFSERDVIYCLKTDGAVMLDWPVERVMTAPAITVSTDVSVLHCNRLNGDYRTYRIDRIETEAEAMRNYIQSA